MAKKKSGGIKTYKPIKVPAKLGFLSFLGDVQGCGTIRIIHPYLLLNHYRRPNLQVISQTMNNFVFDPNFYKNFTFAQFQRSATQQHYNIFVFFKKEVQKIHKIPLIYEIDDLLLGIPGYNYASDYYKNNEDWIKRCMGLSDGMVVTTQQLADIYGEFCKNITIIPNHLPKFIWGDIFPAHDYYQEGAKPKILWAGSQNHFVKKGLTRDKAGGDFGKELMKFIELTTGAYDWYFVGALPEELEHIKSKLCWIPWKHIFEYPKAVKDIEPDLCIAPLIDNVFNSCKSNIKLLEFTAMGAPGIYSDVAPYKEAMVKVKTDEEMIAEIEKMASDIDYRKKVYRHDYGKVRDQLWWEEGNNIKKYINSFLNLFGQRLP
jgi:hypothetical protein